MEDGDSPESSTLPNPSLINGDISEEEEEEEEEEGLQNSETGYVLLPMNASSEDEEGEEEEEEREGSGSGGGVPNSAVAESAPTPDDKGRSDTSDLPMEECKPPLLLGVCLQLILILI